MKDRKPLLHGFLGITLLSLGCFGMPSAFAETTASPQLEDVEPGISTLTSDRESAGSNSQSLFESTDVVSGLLSPLDSSTETERAMQGAGRVDPFKVPVTQQSINPNDTGSEDEKVISEPSGPNIAESIRVNGIIQVGNEIFALVKSPSATTEAVQAGDTYESVKIASISVNSGEVVLQEGEDIVVTVLQ